MKEHKVFLCLITKHIFSLKSFKNATFRTKCYFYFARIPLFSRKMISFAYIPANPRCQMPTDRGSGFQGTQIGGTRLQNRELRTFPICHFLKIDSLGSGRGRRARPRCSAGLALGQERGEGSCRECRGVCRAVLRAGGTPESLGARGSVPPAWALSHRDRWAREEAALALWPSVLCGVGVTEPGWGRADSVCPQFCVTVGAF